MFNSVNNPFGRAIESSVSTGHDKKQNEQNQQKEEENTHYLENDDNDQVKISKLPELSEEDIIFLTKQYINNLKSEHEDNKKTVEKLDKYLSKFDVKKFMKNNPHMTSSDFYMVMYNETVGLVN